MVLAGIEGLGVEADDPPSLPLEQRPRAGREILQTRADSENDVRLAHEVVRGRGACHADRTHVERMAGRERRLAGLGLAHRDAVHQGEGGEFTFRAGIERAAATDDEGPLRVLQPQDCGREFVRIRARSARRPNPLLEEMGREVEGLGLHVLAEAERHRAAFGGVGQNLHGPSESRDDLLRPRDAVEVA